LWTFLEDDVDIAAIAVPDTFKAVISDAIGFQDFATDKVEPAMKIKKLVESMAPKKQ
jgi:hypothetical protein